MRILILLTVMTSLHSLAVAQSDTHIVVFSGMAGYWHGTMEVRQQGEIVSVVPASLHARLAQDGSQLILHHTERHPGTLHEYAQVISFDSDSLILHSTRVRKGGHIERRFHVQGLQKVRSPFQWVIRRVETGELATFRVTDIMQNDSLIIVAEQSDNGLEWYTSFVLRLDRRTKPGAVQFRLPGHDKARQVSVIGDFNDWTPDRALMHRGRNGWSLALDLPPGEYQYVFWIDGKRLPDRLSATSISDGQGGQNAITVVR